MSQSRSRPIESSSNMFKMLVELHSNEDSSLDCEKKKRLAANKAAKLTELVRTFWSKFCSPPDEGDTRSRATRTLGTLMLLHIQMINKSMQNCSYNGFGMLYKLSSSTLMAILRINSNFRRDCIDRSDKSVSDASTESHFARKILKTTMSTVSEYQSLKRNPSTRQMKKLKNLSVLGEIVR